MQEDLITRTVEVTFSLIKGMLSENQYEDFKDSLRSHIQIVLEHWKDDHLYYTDTEADFIEEFTEEFRFLYCIADTIDETLDKELL